MKTFFDLIVIATCLGLSGWLLLTVAATLATINAAIGG